APLTDALLADLETTTSHISKRPVLPPPPPYNPQGGWGEGGCSLHSAHPLLPPSTVCKPRSPRPKEPAAPPFSSSSGVLGAGLCELDRLLQELNATQFNITDEIMSQFPTNKSPDGEKWKENSAGSTPPPVKPSATSATLELDKLMASLSDFRVQSNLRRPQPPPESPWRSSRWSPAPQGGNLDSMLVMLQSDLSRQGISTSTKGLCASCQKPIAGQVRTGLGVPGVVLGRGNQGGGYRTQGLGGRRFWEWEGQIRRVGGRCGGCGRVVTALGNTWHPEHFVCTHCQKEMGGSNFFEKDGAPYCERDYFQLFSPRCGLCNEPILDVSWCGACTHPSCPSSQECYAPFLQGSFFEHGGRPFCETHYHKQRGSLCWGCEKPIAGRCITAMARKFHPEHFVCAFCLKQLNKGTFKEQNDKPYCHPCFLKLFG
uniref:Transforming growth factor beta 1 induced transcript 1 n=1 Tax=Chelonoidis abingdonii TaxID=106734 RepID=A0A8C0G6H2_CHEAB